MKKLFKFALLVGLSLSIIACGKDDNNNNNNNNNNGNNNEPNGNNENQPQILLVKAECSYTQNDNPEYIDETTILFTYNDKNQLVGHSSDQKYGNNYTHKTDISYYYDKTDKIAGMICTTAYNNRGGNGIEKDSSNVTVDANNNIVKATFFNDYDNFANPSEILEYKWNNGKLIEVKNVLDNTTYPLSYTNGNVTFLNWNSPEGIITYTATFDNKKNLFSLISQALIVNANELDRFICAPEDDDMLAILNDSNITKSTFVDTDASDTPIEKSYTYEYNEDGYPTKRIATSRNGVETYTYTYEKR